MATTSDMNTPEYESKQDNIRENKQQYINRIPTQFRRIQGRDYGRILREYNKPAQWYQPSPITRSIYYYDPLYQKYLQQQQQQPKSVSNNRVSIKILLSFLVINDLIFQLNPSSIQVSNQSKSRTRYTTTSHYPQQKSTLPSRLRSVPTLPSIVTHKKSIGE